METDTLKLLDKYDSLTADDYMSETDEENRERYIKDERSAVSSVESLNRADDTGILNHKTMLRYALRSSGKKEPVAISSRIVVSNSARNACMAKQLVEYREALKNDDIQKYLNYVVKPYTLHMILDDYSELPASARYLLKSEGRGITFIAKDLLPHAAMDKNDTSFKRVFFRAKIDADGVCVVIKSDEIVADFLKVINQNKASVDLGEALEVISTSGRKH